MAIDYCSKHADSNKISEEANLKKFDSKFVIKDLMLEEVRKIFNIENDFTSKEEAAVRNEHEWAFEVFLSIALLLGDGIYNFIKLNRWV
ncbi:hypothetical protein ACSBR1_007433 [Camellia fascicularis]